MAHKRELAMRSTHSRIHIHIFLRAGSVVVVVKKVAKFQIAKSQKKETPCKSVNSRARSLRHGPRGQGQGVGRRPAAPAPGAGRSARWDQMAWRRLAAAAAARRRPLQPRRLT
jgi:hypothetical protein